MDAFERAVKTWSNLPVLHHSDRGVQYASGDFRQLLDSYEVEPSMSRKANCYDNAAMESFWATLKSSIAIMPRRCFLITLKPFTILNAFILLSATCLHWSLKSNFSPQNWQLLLP
jgi:transposase InsO family protein